MTARVTVRLTPRGGRDKLEGWRDDVLLARVAAPPAGGAANEALVRLLARTLDIAPSSVRIARGDTARIKTVIIQGIDDAEARRRLSEAMQ
jgi:uncharacterized protein YggU (UPF0235/DUF167 family)